MFLKRNQFYWRRRLALPLIVSLAFGSFSGVIAPQKAAAAPEDPLPSWASKAVLWLKADAGATTATNDPITTLTGWKDQTGKVGFEVKGTVGYQASGTNFNPVVTISGNTGNLTAGLKNYLSGNKQVKYADGYAVFKGNGAVVGSVNEVNNYGFAVFGSESTYLGVGNGVNSTYYTYPFNSGTAKARHHLTGYDISAGSESPTATKADASVNGKSGKATLVHEGRPMPTSLVFTPMIGGTNSNGSSSNWYNYNGEIAEVILFPESTAENRSKIESYLALKYGITLNGGQSDYVGSDGKPFWSKDANAGYGYRIAGIGKDSGSGLEQKQSKSQEEGALVTIALGKKIEATNAENTNSVDDLSFFTFGDNGETINYEGDIEETPGRILKLMKREFKVQKTKWQDAEITLKLDTTKVNSADLHYLVIRDAARTTTELVPLNAAGEATINSSKLGNGYVFSFANVNKAVLQEKADEIDKENLKEADYTPASWQALQKALANAKTVLGNANATQAEVDAAKEALETARKGLASVNKAALQEKVKEINDENLKAESYTPGSWQALQNALADAKTVLGNPNATQADVDKAKEALETARKGLASVNKAALQEKVKGIEDENLKADSYTPASWEALQSALADAKTVLGNPNATQADVDAALKELETARNGLVPASPA
ncbi:FIVAR domain-containing protein, partial [Paenibacillus elgii]